MRIKTNYDPKPIPDRNFDWSALDDSTYDGSPGSLIGYGATEQAARDDFMDLWLEREADRDTKTAVTYAKIFDGVIEQIITGKPR